MLQLLFIFKSIFRISKPESVQYFQFDSEGNMYMYPPGSGFSGKPKLVQPGDELFVEEQLPTSENFTVSACSHEVNCQVESTLSTISSSRSFKTPLCDVELEELSHKNFAPDTVKKIKWAVKMYREWRNNRNGGGIEQIECDLDKKETITSNSLVYALPRFITEVKKVDGGEYPGKTLYEIVICLQFHLESIGFGWKLISEESFKEVKFTLDNVMKLRTRDGLGLSVRKAEVLNSLDEEYLWNMGYFGVHTPEVLSNTLVFVIGKGFALRAGKEHHCLRSPPFDSQFQFMNDEGGVFIRYTEDIGLKTNKGGIKHKRVEAKHVDLFPIANVDRCPVQIILKYLSLLHPDRKFYLQPKKKFSQYCYYLDRPAGENRLRDTIKEVCKSANLPGFYSNHSLRSTACTRMYHCNIDEQLIMEITGHGSLSVRSYKRICIDQRKFASNCLFENLTSSQDHV